MGFLSLLTGPFGKIILYAIGAVALIGVLTGAYFYWEHKITEVEQLQLQNTQLKQDVKDKADEVEKVKDLRKLDDDSTVDLNKVQDQIGLNDAAVQAGIAASKDDKPASDLFKDTIRALGKTQ